MSFLNKQGIVVYQTADNISYVVVEGRPGQQNRRLACGAIDNGVPVASAIAMIEFYGVCGVSVCLSVSVYACVHLFCVFIIMLTLC